MPRKGTVELNSGLIEEIMRREGLTQEKVCERAGWEENQLKNLQRILQGRPVTMETFVEISGALKVKPIDLLLAERKATYSDVLQGREGRFASVRYDKLHGVLSSLLTMPMPPGFDVILARMKDEPSNCKRIVLEFRNEVNAHYVRICNLAFVNEHLLDLDLKNEIKDAISECQSHDEKIEALRETDGEPSQDELMGLLFTELRLKGVASSLAVQSMKKQLERLTGNDTAG